MLAPPTCGVCGAACAATAPVCRNCLAALRAQPGAGSAGDLAVAWAAPYAGPARELVTALKFGGRLGLAGLAADAVSLVAESRFELGGRVVVPVPAAPLRLLARGFDPGELIASAVARRLGLPLARCLTRRSGRRQVGRDRLARLANPPRVKTIAPAPRAVLLVDDVLTTGATLRACACALRAGGCADIAAAVFARALGAARPEAYD